MKTTPRIEFKIGCVLVPEVFNEAFPRMVYAASMEAPELFGDTMVITSCYREGSAGYHGKCRAIDIRTGLTGTNKKDLGYRKGWTGAIAEEPSLDTVIAEEHFVYSVALEWAQRIRDRLGDEYDVIYGFNVKHVNHIHIEHDYTKHTARYRRTI